MRGTRNLAAFGGKRYSPKQLQLFQTDARDVMFTGGRFSTKTGGALLKCMAFLSRRRGLTGLWLRRTYKSLEDVRQQARMFAPRFGAIAFKDWVQFPNGAILHFQHCNSLSMAQIFQGWNVQILVVDEASQFPWEWIKLIRLCCRASAEMGVRPQRIYCSNPAGGFGSWGAQEFIIPARKYGTEVGDRYYEWNDPVEGTKRAWISSNITDNAFATGEQLEEYYQYLLNLPQALRQQWLLDDWSAIEGQFIPNVNEYVMSYDRRTSDPHWLLFDFGWDNPMATLFSSVGDLGEQYVFGEFKRRHTHVDDYATMIKKILGTRERNEYDSGLPTFTPEIDYYRAVGDASGRSNSGITGESYIGKFQANGIRIEPSLRDHHITYPLVRGQFTCSPDGTPRTMIDPDCIELIGQLQALITNPDDPEVPLDEPGQDLVDCYRYGVAALRKPSARVPIRPYS